MDASLFTVEPNEPLVWARVITRQLSADLSGRVYDGVLEAAARQTTVPVVLDLSGVDFLPSVALGDLVRLMRGLKSGGRRFALVGLTPAVRSTLTVTRLDRLFEIYTGRDDALARLCPGITAGSTAV